MSNGASPGRTPGTRSANKDEYFEGYCWLMEICSFNKTCDVCTNKKRCNALYEKHVLNRPGRNMRPLDVAQFVSAFGPLMKTAVKK